jgi:hypothetical protein
MQELYLSFTQTYSGKQRLLWSFVLQNSYVAIVMFNVKTHRFAVITSAYAYKQQIPVDFFKPLILMKDLVYGQMTF